VSLCRGWQFSRDKGAGKSDSKREAISITLSSVDFAAFPVLPDILGYIASMVSSIF